MREGGNHESREGWSVLQGLMILLMAVLFGVAPALAQAPAAKKELAATKPVGATAKAEPVRTGEPAASSGPQEGIKVHGHWVIEVRNPDGTLASRTEFENSLNGNGAGSGADFLAKVLRHQIVFGSWGVRLTGSSSPPCPGGTRTGGVL